MPPPRYQLARAFKSARRTSTSITYASTSWGNFDTALDITLDGQVGDSIEVQASGQIGSEAVYGCLDVGTLVAGSIINVFSTGVAETAGAGDGIQAWLGTPSANNKIGGGCLYALQATDIATGLVTMRLRVRCTAASTKTWFISSGDPFQWWAKNLGPADPN